MKSLLLIGALLMLLASCTSVSVNGDQEAVLVEKPWIFGHGGVDSIPVSAGQEWCALSTDYITYSIVPQNQEDSLSKVMTLDNTPVEVIAYLKYKIQKGNTPKLYKGWGVDWYTHTITPIYYPLIREKCSTAKMFELTSNRIIVDNIEKEILDALRNYVKSQNLPVDMISFSVGKVIPPDEVLEETRRTAAQNQSILTQRARANAELSRKQAEINKADADKAYKNEMGMSTPEYLSLRGLEIEKEKIELVRDKPNVTIIMGQGLVPVVNVK